MIFVVIFFSSMKTPDLITVGSFTRGEGGWGWGVGVVAVFVSPPPSDDYSFDYSPRGYPLQSPPPIPGSALGRSGGQLGHCLVRYFWGGTGRGIEIINVHIFQLHPKDKRFFSWAIRFPSSDFGPLWQNFKDINGDCEILECSNYYLLR